jgi:hypothetical protein
MVTGLGGHPDPASIRRFVKLRERTDGPPTRDAQL